MRFPSPTPNSSAHNIQPTSQLSFTHQYRTTENIATVGPSHPRPEPISPDERPRTKMRRPDSEERGERYTGRSSPSNSSQSDRGDHESDGEHNKPSASPTTYEFAEPKKKRTRTLTTPHQAAVLHALLAQVCFFASMIFDIATELRL